MHHKKSFGQFFTKNELVQNIFASLINNNGLVIEPSAGQGDLLSKIKDRKICAFEIDKSLCVKNADCVFYGCFFENILRFNKSISTIVSNPPYVNLNEYRTNISSYMQNFMHDKGYVGRPNIAYLFIHKCAEVVEEGGELVFIVPKDFTYSTSALPLRSCLESLGTFTHWVECGEEKIFQDACPETTIIFRWKKEKCSNTICYNNLESFPDKYSSKKEIYVGENKTIFFIDNYIGENVLGDFFDIKVGSVSGFDGAFKVNPNDFKSNEAIQEFVTGFNKTAYFINTNNYKNFVDLPTDIQTHLLYFREKLLNRYSIKSKENNIKQNNKISEQSIKSFIEKLRDDLWWKWSFIRNMKYSMGSCGLNRIYSFSKTRAQPFVVGRDLGFVSSVYGLFPKFDTINIRKVVDMLNSEEYKKLYSSSGMLVNNKFMATPKALKNIPVCDICNI